MISDATLILFGIIASILSLIFHAHPLIIGICFFITGYYMPRLKFSVRTEYEE